MVYSETELHASKHPCYSPQSQHSHARMHLPVAPACNIQCNYCNRLYDCVNESRPGVTSEILNPDQALAKIGLVIKKIPNLAVIGIAGPGDALANWPAVRATLVGVKQAYPELILCLSTNGLLLPRLAEELVAIGVRHVTVTVNSVDACIGEQIYHHVDWEGVRLRGKAAAELLIEQQLSGLHRLSKADVLIKVNIVMIPGINDSHIPLVVKTVKNAGASLTNIMPLIPASGSAFSHLPQTSHKEINRMRDGCASILPQMRHCQQCRADAIGLLTQDRAAEFRDSPSCENGLCSELLEPVADGQCEAPYRMAVTSKRLSILKAG